MKTGQMGEKVSFGEGRVQCVDKQVEFEMPRVTEGRGPTSNTWLG